MLQPESMIAANLRAPTHTVNTEVITRLATLADVTALTDLLVSYQAFYDYTPDREAARAFLHDGLATGQAIIFMTTRGDEALGYLQISPGFYPAQLRRTYAISNLYVSSKARGLGVGSRLMEAARDYAQAHNAMKMTLMALPDLWTSQAFYESHGWRHNERLQVFELPLNPVPLATPAAKAEVAA